MQVRAMLSLILLLLIFVYTELSYTTTTLSYHSVVDNRKETPAHSQLRQWQQAPRYMGSSLSSVCPHCTNQKSCLQNLQNDKSKTQVTISVQKRKKVRERKKRRKKKGRGSQKVKK